MTAEITYPDGHAKHFQDSPSVLYCPRGHLVHEPAPGADANCPLTHLVQVEMLVCSDLALALDRHVFRRRKT